MPHKIIFWREKKKKKKKREKKEESWDFSIWCPSVSFLLLFLPGCKFTHFGEAFPIL